MRLAALALCAAFVTGTAQAQSFDSATSLTGPDISGQMAAALAPYALTVALPTPAVSLPPCVADVGALGSVSTVYALASHTHCSKVRKAHETTDAAGLRTVTFTTAFAPGVIPICLAQAVPTAGVTDVINVQTDGDPTNTSATFRVTRTNRSVVALIGLTVLSVPGPPGATKFDYACFEL